MVFSKELARVDKIAAKSWKMGCAWVDKAIGGATASHPGRPRGLVGYYSQQNNINILSKEPTKRSGETRRASFLLCLTSSSVCTTAVLQRDGWRVGPQWSDAAPWNLRNHQHRDVPQHSGCARPCEPAGAALRAAPPGFCY
jgi:hypothetical protein